MTTEIITLTNEERDFLCALNDCPKIGRDGWIEAKDLARELDMITAASFNSVAWDLARHGIIDYLTRDSASIGPARVRLNYVNWSDRTVTADHVKFMEALAALQERTGKKLIARGEVKKALQWTPRWFNLIEVSLEVRRWIYDRYQWKGGENVWMNFNPAGRKFLAELRKEKDGRAEE